MSQITLKAAILLQAMRKRYLVPALNYITAKTGYFFINPDIDPKTKKDIFTDAPENSTNPILSAVFKEDHSESVMPEIVATSLFELATGNTKTIKRTTDGKGATVSTVEEFHKPDFQAIKFYLENVDPANWKDKQTGGTTDDLISACKASYEKRKAAQDA